MLARQDDRTGSYSKIATHSFKLPHNLFLTWRAICLGVAAARRHGRRALRRVPRARQGRASLRRIVAGLGAALEPLGRRPSSADKAGVSPRTVEPHYRHQWQSLAE